MRRPWARACPRSGKTLFQGIREYAEQNNIEIEGLPKDPNADVPPEQLLHRAAELPCHHLPPAGLGRPESRCDPTLM